MKRKIILLIVLLLLVELTVFVQPSKKSTLPRVFKPFKEVQMPKYIYVPKLNLFLSLQTAPIKNNEWVLNKQKTAFFGEGSALPGETGTTAIFAHAKNGLFAKLPVLRKDDRIIVIFGKEVFLYKITKRQIMEPSDTSFLTKKEANQLAIFTCFGKNNSKRIVYTADFIKSISLLKINNSLYQI